VHAGSGGVGGFAIQLAKRVGATVVATCSAANADYIRDLGADEVIDYRTENIFARAQEFAGARLFDRIVDTIGPKNGVDNLRLLAPEGGIAFIAGIPDLSGIDALPYSISIHDIGLGGVLVAPQFRRQQENLAKMASEMIALVERNEIRSTVSSVISLEEIPKSMTILAEGHVRGKIVARLIRDY
jgi:NADPH:quinone reductase-like Zn-dependent oxidoreductase